jgi:hypothetical protein
VKVPSDGFQPVLPPADNRDSEGNFTLPSRDQQAVRPMMAVDRRMAEELRQTETIPEAQ